MNMMFIVRTRLASGVNTDALFKTEFEGINALQSEFSMHRKNGNTVTQQHPSYAYIVTDTLGAFVQHTELIFPG
jgi:hypothetical protein